MNRYSGLFRSRWNALLWAIGVCWSVYWFAAPSDEAPPANGQVAQTDATGTPYSDADVAALQATLNRLQHQ
ncbi:MAG: hypothetical protein JOZ90_16860 [Alphaproteobacteria bacterium]|nr:hypothetical protein [Alphaproteobacteria bacterium]MBV9371516.1 hypothetical protein [Alphaproteobacteria bacterium]MBV9902742.1 hypothetical protein [Alphaproteobacteria bacterium]